jgi:hypothetical protein
MVSVCTYSFAVVGDVVSSVLYCRSPARFVDILPPYGCRGNVVAERDMANASYAVKFAGVTLLSLYILREEKETFVKFITTIAMSLYVKRCQSASNFPCLSASRHEAQNAWRFKQSTIRF